MGSNSSALKNTMESAEYENAFDLEIRDAPPTDLLIKIGSFSRLWKYGIQKSESKEFVVGSFNWRLTMYPNGRRSSTCRCMNESESEHICVFLCVVNTDRLPVKWEVHAICTIFLHNQILNKYFCFKGKARRFDSRNSTWGFSISKTTFKEPSNGYLVRDKCAFGAEVKVLINKHRHRHRVDDYCFSLSKFTTFDCVISGWSKLEKIWFSQIFSAGVLEWRMMVYPNGFIIEKSGNGHGNVSIYVECVSSPGFAPHEIAKAIICIRMRNISRSVSHCFTSSSSVCGFHDFISIRDMHDPCKAFLVNDSCYLQAQVSVQNVVC